MNTTQSGRSMLEMLAVLCVIGVLTVGVLLGYRQGMIRYKTYRTYVELSEAIDGVYRVCGFWGSLKTCTSDIGGELKSGGILPENLKNPFGKAYTFNIGSGKDQTIITNVDTDDICAELKAEDWPAGVIMKDDEGAAESKAPQCIGPAGGDSCASGTTCRLKLHLED